MSDEEKEVSGTIGTVRLTAAVPSDNDSLLLWWRRQVICNCATGYWDTQACWIQMLPWVLFQLRIVWHTFSVVNQSIMMQWNSIKWIQMIILLHTFTHLLTNVVYTDFLNEKYSETVKTFIFPLIITLNFHLLSPVLSVTRSLLNPYIILTWLNIYCYCEHLHEGIFLDFLTVFTVIKFLLDQWMHSQWIKLYMSYTF